jgi:hypothetical protein
MERCGLSGRQRRTRRQRICPMANERTLAACGNRQKLSIRVETVKKDLENQRSNLGDSRDDCALGSVLARLTGDASVSQGDWDIKRRARPRSADGGRGDA